MVTGSRALIVVGVDGVVVCAPRQSRIQRRHVGASLCIDRVHRRMHSVEDCPARIAAPAISIPIDQRTESANPKSVLAVPVMPKRVEADKARALGADPVVASPNNP